MFVPGVRVTVFIALRPPEDNLLHETKDELFLWREITES